MPPIRIPRASWKATSAALCRSGCPASIQEKRLGSAGGIALQVRDWFNPELRSADAIVPGVIAMVMTMAGTLLTAGGVAREWEHGTMESMLASPAHLGELILARLGCNFALGIGSMLVSLLLAVVLFGVPFRGGLLALALAVSLFLVFALGWGCSSRRWRATSSSRRKWRS